MAKEKKKVTEITALEGTEPMAEKKARKAPQPREVADERLYLPELENAKHTEPTTVFGAMRQFVLDNGGSALRSEIFAHMMANFTPKKSQMDKETYIKSYLRDVVTLRFLSNQDHGIKVLASKPVREKKETSKDSNGLSDMGKSLLVALSKELTAGEVEAGTSSVTVESLATSVGKNPQTVRMSLKSLVKNEIAVYVKSGESEFIALTQKGWDLAQTA